MLNFSSTELFANLSIRYISSTSTSTGLNLIGPAVKLMLQQYKVEPNEIKPSGPKNNILKSDILNYITIKKISKQEQHATNIEKSETFKPKPLSSLGKGSEKYIDIPLSSMRATIAKRLASSKKSIPHTYASASIVADDLLNLRKIYAKEGIKISVNDFILKAVALSLKTVPEINVQWKNDAVISMPTIDVSIAVATPNGLITPIIFGADKLQIEQISNMVRELSTKARENKLKPQEFQGGTFTVSNLGMYGITNFTAIINPPQTAILAVGGLNLALNENLRPINQIMITLCYDNRAIQEMDAQRFLNSLDSFLSNPDMLLLGVQKLHEINL